MRSATGHSASRASRITITASERSAIFVVRASVEFSVDAEKGWIYAVAVRARAVPSRVSARRKLKLARRYCSACGHCLAMAIHPIRPRHADRSAEKIADDDGRNTRRRRAESEGEVRADQQRDQPPQPPLARAISRA